MLSILKWICNLNLTAKTKLLIACYDWVFTNAHPGEECSLKFHGQSHAVDVLTYLNLQHLNAWILTKTLNDFTLLLISFTPVIRIYIHRTLVFSFSAWGRRKLEICENYYLQFSSFLLSTYFICKQNMPIMLIRYYLHDILFSYYCYMYVTWNKKMKTYYIRLLHKYHTYILYQYKIYLSALISFDIRILFLYYRFI